MSQLQSLKSAQSLHDVARLLNFKPKALAYILYIKHKNTLYREFEIPKSSGGVRTICAPCTELKNLQKRLSNLLLNCLDELHKAREEKLKRKISSSISHAFSKNKSIITNAVNHRNRRYVFNADLHNFFGEISFPRIRGFFIKSREFELAPAVATILAQIACFNDVLPQGSPSSPVISNLIAHILDIHLAELAKKNGCTYTRYADDLTFSTNLKEFPEAIAKYSDLEDCWMEGDAFSKIVSRTGFSFNSSKTRMQISQSRQEVTGLVVNSKVNSKVEYRKNARSMVHELLKTGTFYRRKFETDETGNETSSQVLGTMAQLNGMLNFIDMIGIYNRGKNTNALASSDLKRKDTPAVVPLTGDEKVYKKFLFYRNFISPVKPIILCEGKTDYIYLQCAIRSLIANYPYLGTMGASKKIEYHINFLRFSSVTARFFGLAGGSQQLKNFIVSYDKECEPFNIKKFTNPVIFIIDNDSGASEIYSTMKRFGIIRDDKLPFYKLSKNLYLITTPPVPGTTESMIENFFHPSVTGKKIGHKVFSWDNNYDKDKTYGKHYFSEYIVKKERSVIDFGGFSPILDRVMAVIQHFSANP